MTINSIKFLQKLIQCPSVTPNVKEVMDLMEETLTSIGFKCHRMTFEEEGFSPVENLYARIGNKAPNLCFAGHVDVVPVGDEQAWSFDPFGGEIINDYICGRGAVDMKCGVAAFVSAVSKYLDELNTEKGSISFLITGDEEGVAINGTQKLLKWCKESGEIINHCIVGEPTNPENIGDMIKIGRRGTMTGTLTVKGTQGHVAYPHLADNPLPHLVKLLDTLSEWIIDDGNDNFQPSNLEIVTINAGGIAENVIPADGIAKFNIRFNDLHNSTSLEKELRSRLDVLAIAYELEFRVSGESFLTPHSDFTDTMISAVKNITGDIAELSTTGGTSDARFITNYCPVVEFGGINKTAHQIDEKIKISDQEKLTEIYLEVLRLYLK